MFEAPSGKTNHSVSASQPATGLSTTFGVAATNFERLSTGFPRLSRTPERRGEGGSMLVRRPAVRQASAEEPDSRRFSGRKRRTTKRPKEPRYRSLRLQCKHQSR